MQKNKLREQFRDTSCPRRETPMSTLSLAALPAQVRTLFPGVLASAVVAAAATFLSQHYGAPVMLFALLLGIAMNFLSAEAVPAPRASPSPGARCCAWAWRCSACASRTAQVAALGWPPVILVIVSVAVTIAVSMIVARAMGFQSLFGLLSGGATAICGASAALALAAALPGHPQKERATLFTVVGVSALSTLAMIAYPMLAHWLGLDARATGVFLGATIHDVAQVVGAGYGVSKETGDIATFVKLLRVAMLLPVIVFAVMLVRMRGADTGGPRPPILPGFAIAFAVLVAVNSTGWLPPAIPALGGDVSRWCLAASIAAIGMKTQLRDVVDVGLKPVLLMVSETVFLVVLVLALMRWAV
jgi:uncharacterized integral membrane protein (TIGR00698 family)